MTFLTSFGSESSFLTCFGVVAYFGGETLFSALRLLPLVEAFFGGEGEGVFCFAAWRPPLLGAAFGGGEGDLEGDFLAFPRLCRFME